MACISINQHIRIKIYFLQIKAEANTLLQKNNRTNRRSMLTWLPKESVEASYETK